MPTQTANPGSRTPDPAPAPPPSPETCTATQEGQTAIPAGLEPQPIACLAELHVDGCESDDSDAPFAGDGEFAPFVVFNASAQANLPGEYATRADAQAALRQAEAAFTPTLTELEAMVSGYLAAMLWSSVGENGRMLDATHGLDDVSPKAKAKARDACIDFLRGAVAAGVTLDALRPLEPLRGLDFEDLGSDLWLTRNRHGAGFWDRDLGKLGAALSKVAFAMGSRDAYLGGDDLVYVD